MEALVMDLTDADVTDILALLDTLPYDELDLETSRFRLTLRRTPHGWTQSTQVLSAPAPWRWGRRENDRRRDVVVRASSNGSIVAGGRGPAGKTGLTGSGEAGGE